ncbi:outer membrane protein [Puniceibacterium sediminis]|uniref:Opacity protein n=1 Tax=Puniceibacterium sediminis TaxID=1608407 RepID=A0A238YS64_9RHOB|nr:outer membrane beta-barrel protein [Puniceibacterium sediminis]SNR73668.1 Opacity protein [Puniceibacterium sediminis]
MTRTLALTTALLGTLAMPAFAGSPEAGYVEPAPMAPAPVAVVATQDWTGFSLGAQAGYGSFNSENPEDDDAAGTFGVKTGYDYDMGSYVVGGGLQYDKTDIDLGGANVDGVLRAGGRIGADMGKTLPYFAAGYAKAFTDNDTIGDSNGYYAGLGIEHMLTTNVSLGGEVLYNKFDKFDTDFEADATTANVSLNYRF